MPPEPKGSTETDPTWTWSWEAKDAKKGGRPRSTSRHRGKQPKGGSDKSGDAQWATSPFQPSTSASDSMWSSTYHGQTPFSMPWETTEAPAWVAPSDKTNLAADVNADWLQALRDAYPDPSTIPTRLKEMLDKQETVSSQKLNAEMKKATAGVVKARTNLQKLQDSRAKHRQSWLQHLASTLKTWTSHMETFDAQQKEFQISIRKAKQELIKARQTSQELHQKAGTMLKDDSDQEASLLPETEPNKKDEAALRAHVQQLLQQCVQQAETPHKGDIMDVSSDEEQRAIKRARSTERPEAPVDETTEAAKPDA